MKRPAVWRSVAAACVAWPTAWFCMDPSRLRAQAVVSVAAFAVVPLLWLRHRSHAPVWTALLVVVVIAAAVGYSALVQVNMWRASPWPAVIEDRQLIEVRVELTGEPRMQSTNGLGGSGYDSVSGPAKVHLLTLGPQSWALRSDVWLTAPAHDPPLGRGDLLRARVRSSEAELRRGIAAYVTVVDILEVQPQTSVRSTIDTWFDAALARGSGDAAALVRGMAIGDDSDLAPDTRERVQRVGLSHLTAVSGANLAIVVATVLGIGSVMGLPRKVMLLPAGLAMLGYTVLVGAEPSVLRASAMAVVMLAAMVVGGGAGSAALGTAITVLLVWQPALAASRGFALSASATAGLVLATPLGRTLLDRVGRSLANPWRTVVSLVVATVLTATAAAVATAPLLAAYGNGLSWISVLANAAVAALVPVITVAGLLGAACAPLYPAAAMAICEIPLLGAQWILAVSSVADSVRFGRLDLPPGWVGFGVVLALMVLVWSTPLRWRTPLGSLVAVAIAGGLLGVQLPAARFTPPAQWLVVFCDVGQGDAALVRTGEHSALVIDTGPEPQPLQECIRRNNVTVDAVVLTHFHLDHVGGLPVVVDTSTQHLWVSPLSKPAEIAEQVRTLASESRMTEVIATAGAQHRYGWVSLQVWGPETTITDGSPPNNNSVVLRVVIDPPERKPVGQHPSEDTVTDAPVQGDVEPSPDALAVLFTGDIEPEAQSRLMRRASDPYVDVAKVPHHGSANQHPQFAGWVGASLAVVSCGSDNPYGHPADTTVGAWNASGAAVRRTDLEGDIYVWSAGDGQVVTASLPAKGIR